jgi:hypothetical protein
MTLKSEYDNLDGDLKHLIASSDSEIAELEQAANPVRLELPEIGGTVSAAESAALRDEVESNALIEEMLGIRSPSVLKVEATAPLGMNGKPLGPGGGAKSTEELEQAFQRLLKAVAEGVERGDPTALKIVSGNGTDTRTPTLLKRMAERADEFLSEDSPMIPFIKAYALDDHAGMRRAVRPLAQEMVAAEV